MAEYTEVMKQRQRMCDFYMSTAHPCYECRLCSSRNRTSLGCRAFTIEHPEEAEKIIMGWVKEHPVKTNADKFKEVFGVEFAPEGCTINPQKCNGQCNLCEAKGFWEREYKDPK